MTAIERARAEGRREGLREAVALIEEKLKPPSDHFQRDPAPDLPARLALALRELRALATGPAQQQRLDGREDGAAPQGGFGGAAAGAQEITARTLIVLQAHLQAREKFFRAERGVYQPPTAAAMEEAKKEVRAALHRHREVTGDREKWKKESSVLAAGIGILYSEPHNGELEKEKKEKEMFKGQRLPTGWLPKLYLELWRPWKLQKGKPDPVPGFAEKCFERRRGERGA